MGENKVTRGKNHDEVGALDWLAAGTNCVMELLQRFASGDHVGNVNTHFYNHLLRNHNPEAKLFTKGVLS